MPKSVLTVSMLGGMGTVRAVLFTSWRQQVVIDSYLLEASYWQVVTDSQLLSNSYCQLVIVS